MEGERHYVDAELFCSSVRDGTHDSPKPVNEGRFLVTSRHITGGRVDLADAYLISQDDFDAINKRSKVDQWDVLVSMIGTVGEACLVREEPTFAIKNIGLFKSKSEMEGKWLYYFLRTPAAQQLIREHSRGTTQQYIPLGALREFPILVPEDSDEMRAIVNILGSLDDKIEANREMNDALEEAARVLFNSWFVDFDPVRAKVEGQEIRLPRPFVDLFPDAFEDSELGEIPLGWQASRISENLVTVLGGTPSREEPSFWGGDIPWINSGKANEFRIIEPSEFISREGLDKSATTILPSRTTVIAITGATMGKVSLTEIETCANQSIVGVIGNDNLPSEFIYFWIKNRIDELLSWQTGAAQQHINKNNVNDLSLLIPSEMIMRAFISHARPSFDRIKEGCLESRTLASVRDTLLPKLISGDLTLNNVERFVDAQRLSIE